MTDQGAPVRKHKHTAKEHLATLQGERTEVQALAAEHLSRSEAPTHDQATASE